MASIPSSIYKTIEWAFFNYEGLKQAVQEYENETIDGLKQSMTPSNMIRGAGRYSDRTALSAIELAEDGTWDIRRYRRWINVVEAVTDFYSGTRYGQLIRLYYGERLLDEKVCSKLYVERSTFYSMKREVISTSWRVGIECGVLEALA